MATAALGVLGAAGRVWADEASPAPTANNIQVAYPYYRAQELSLDVFGTGSVGEQTLDHVSGARLEHNGRLGGGLGLNYFFTRCVGVGGDVYTENEHPSFVYSASGNLIVRVPLGDSGVAPYVFGGGGYQFDEVAQRFGQVGAGVEFRFNQQAGLFVDGRYVITDRTENYGVGRVGLRVSF